ncbi:MAG: sugar ABC transporter permease [Phycisphaerales bacterium]|nr:sugar ABC transporter permease [Phycisphaerales bacterium]
MKGLAFTSPWLIGFLGLTIIPCALSLYYSFCDYSVLEPPVWIGLENYRELLIDPEFYRTLRNTAYYALLTIPAGLMVSLGLALLLNAPIKGQAIYRTVIFLPSLVPAVATAMVWMWLFNARLGLINTALRTIGLETELRFTLVNRILEALNIAPLRPLPFPPAWLSDPRTAMLALALMSLWGVGHTVVIYLAGLQDIPRDLYEAAEIDGAGPVRRLFNVTLPMLSPVIFFNLVMAIIGTLQVFAIPFIMTGGGPLRATYLYTQYLYEKAFMYQQMGYASAMAWIQLLIILALTGIAFGTSRRWVHYQGR